MGVQNACFPLFVTEERLNTEKDHVEGFAAEVQRRLCSFLALASSMLSVSAREMFIQPWHTPPVMTACMTPCNSAQTRRWHGLQSRGPANWNGPSPSGRPARPSYTHITRRQGLPHATARLECIGSMQTLHKPPYTVIHPHFHLGGHLTACDRPSLQTLFASLKTFHISQCHIYLYAFPDACDTITGRSRPIRRWPFVLGDVAPAFARTSVWLALQAGGRVDLVFRVCQGDLLGGRSGSAATETCRCG